MKRGPLTPIFDARPKRGAINPGTTISGPIDHGPCTPVFRLYGNVWRDDRGGSLRSMLYGNGYYYISNGQRLVILDAAAAEVVGEVYINELTFAGVDGNGMALSPSGNYLYMGGYNSGIGLVTIDVSDPTNPTLVNLLYNPITLPRAMWVTRYGNYLYVSWVVTSPDYHYTIIDISSESHPVIVSDNSWANSQGTAYYAADGYLFSLPTSSGDPLLAHYIWSLASPTALSATGSFNLTSPDYMEGAVKDGNLLWVAGGGFVAGGVGCVDMTNPADPFPVGIVGTPPLTNINMYDGDGNLGVSVQGQFSRLAVVDLTDAPRRLRLAAAFTSSPSLDAARAVRVIGSWAYVFCTQRLTTVNLSVPSAPTIGSTVATPFTDSNDFCISGNYAFLTGANTSFFGIYDISNPSAIAGVGSVTDFANLNRSNATAVIGNYCYVATTDAAGRLVVIDVTTKAAPVIVAALTGASVLSAISIFAIGDYIYLGRNAIITIIDVSTPTSPVVVGDFTDPLLTSYPRNFELDGNTLWLSTYASNGAPMLALDVTNPASPTLLGSFLPRGDVYGINIRSNHAFIGSSAFGLDPCVRAIKVENPADARWVGHIPIEWAQEPVLGGSDDLYITSEANDFWLYRADISDPDYPVIIDALEEGASVGARTLAWDDNEVRGMSSMGYTATDASLNVLRRWNETATYGIRSWILDGDRLYTVSGNNSANVVSISDVSDPYHPVVLGETPIPGIETPGGTVPTSWNFSEDFAYQDGRLVLFGQGGFGCIYVLDVTGDTPVLLGTFAFDTTTLPPNSIDFSGDCNLVIDGDYIYVRPDYYFIILNCSDPANITLVSWLGRDQTLLGFPNDANMMHKRGNYIFAYGIEGTAFTGRWHTIDVSNPAVPVIVNSFQDVSLSQNTEQSIKVDNIIYYTTYNNEIRALNINNPLAPVIVGTLSNGNIGVPDKMCYGNNHLYMTTDSPTRITRVNITNPTAMTVDLVYATQLPSTTPGGGYGNFVQYIDDGVVYIGDTYPPASFLPFSTNFGTVWILYEDCL